MKPLRLSLLAATIALTIGLTACTATSATTPPQNTPHGSPTSTETTYPLTLSVPGAEPITIPAEPRRIVALSPDATVALHELGLTDRIVAIPQSARSATINPYADDFAGIENTLAADVSSEPEQILAWNPDLIVVTTRHTGEQDAFAALGSTGVPVLALTNGWSTSDAVIENLEILGEATGTTGTAADIAEEIRTGLRDLDERVALLTDKPSVVVLSNQAHVPLINADDALVSEVVRHGGGINAAATMGITQTMPVQPEQLVSMAPDSIMLIDVTGRGEASFGALLDNPAVAALPAVQEGRVKVFLARDVYAVAGRGIVSGSRAVMEWLHREPAE